MFEFFRKMMPKEERFFDMFERHAALLVSGAKALRALLEGGASVEQNAATVAKFEDEADRVIQEVMDAVHRSFITPFDRSDIQRLITAMDDAIDQMNKTGKVVMLYDVTIFEPNMRAMADRVIMLAKLTSEALPLLRNIGANSAKLHTLTGEITKIEEQSDQLNDEGLRTLYKGRAKKDPLAFIIGSELYDHLEKICDRFEDVAHVVSDIVIEHA